MARPASSRPTDAELAILRVLWERGPSTVRDVHEALKRSRDAGYTSVLKVMQIMHDKRLVARDEAKRSHVYRAAVPREHTQRQMVGDLLERVFGGSARALCSRPCPPSAPARASWRKSASCWTNSREVSDEPVRP